jgi:NADH-quinone oxidoreductase subunit I
MIKYFKDIYSGAQSLAAGLRVTIRYMFRPIVTVQYPREKNRIPPAYRGHLKFTRDPVTGGSRCVVCLRCARTCPSECISLDWEIEGEHRERVLKSYVQDFSRCSLCGLCVEACALGAIKFSNEYELVGLAKEDFHFNLLEMLEKR